LLIKVVSKNIANNTGSDKSNAPFSICWFTSSDSTATAGNNERIVYDNGVIHIVFTSGDSIFYARGEEGKTGVNKGKEGENREMFNVTRKMEKEILHPDKVGAQNDKELEGVVWQPKQLIDFGEYPALAKDEAGNLHLIYKKGNGLYYKEIGSLEPT